MLALITVSLPDNSFSVVAANAASIAVTTTTAAVAAAVAAVTTTTAAAAVTTATAVVAVAADADSASVIVDDCASPPARPSAFDVTLAASRTNYCHDDDSLLIITLYCCDTICWAKTGTKFVPTQS